MNTFQDSKCAVKNCDNIVAWNSLTSVCDRCWEKYGNCYFCPKCRKYVEHYDKNDSPCQHINDNRCVICHAKVVRFENIVWRG